MKRLLPLLFLSILAATPEAWAQPGPPRMNSERLDALRIAFITEELELTPDESKAFWPMHEAFEAQIELQRKSLNDLKSGFDASGASRQDVEGMVTEMSQLRKNLIDLEAAHLMDVVDLLGAERALRLPDLQRDLARRLRERAQGSGRPGGRPGPRQGARPTGRRGAGIH